MKKRLGQGILLASALLVASCVGNNFDNQKLIVGLECDYAPFNWTATTASAYTLPIDGINGQFADGYDIQIAKHLGAEMGKEVIIKKIEWGALIPALQTGDINAIIAANYLMLTIIFSQLMKIVEKKLNAPFVPKLRKVFHA